MKARIIHRFLLCSLGSGLLLAQNGTETPLIEPVPPTPEVEAPAPPPPAVPEVQPDAPAPAPDAQAPAPAADQEMQQSEEGFIIKDANLNDIFQFLAKAAGKQYFHNSKIGGPEFMVTGHLNEGNPFQQMEELAFMYGLSLHSKGNTIYALTQAQLAQLPSTEFHYQLRYLRPTDMEQIKELIKPLLSPATGIVNFEPKTNTIIIIDSAHRIEQARSLLHGIDKAKGQIIVETKILRINSSAAERVGVDWSSSLGVSGTSLNVIRDLNSVFGLNTLTTSVGRGFGDLANGNTGQLQEGTSGPTLVLTPLQLNGVLRALADGGLASQVSNPTLITEDNEQATISIIDRIPIITTSSTQATTGGNPTVTEEVRYKIDQSDKTIDSDPEKHREIGISLVVTPTVLPDGTVRMRMRPRNAQVSGVVLGAQQPGVSTRNEYPRVTEAMIETLARVPDGHSLVVGGFYGEVNNRDRNKVPLFGDLPVINFFFKSKETSKEQTSLVFIVTPKSYDPTSRKSTTGASEFVRTKSTLPCDSEWVDPENPGPAHEPNLRRTLRGAQPEQAPYYPREGELLSPAPQSNNKPRFARGRR